MSFHKVYSQPNLLYLNHNYEFGYYGFTIGNLSGFGTSNILNNASNIASLNPASLESFKDVNFGISYEYASTKDFYFEKASRPLDLKPQSIGIVLPLSNFRLAFSAIKQYNLQVEKDYSDGFSIHENLSNDNKIILNTFMDRYNVSASYSIPRINLSIGAGFNVNYFHPRNSSGGLYQLVKDNYLYENNWQIGLLYKLNLPEDKFLKVGLSYESNFEYENEVKALWRNQNGEMESNFAYYEVAKLPAELKLDAELKVKENLRLIASYNEELWSAINHRYENKRDISFGGLYNFNELTAMSFGALLMQEKTSTYETRNDNVAIFFYAGANTNYKFLNFDLAVADSHISQKEFLKQTIIKFSLGFSF